MKHCTFLLLLIAILFLGVNPISAQDPANAPFVMTGGTPEYSAAVIFICNGEEIAETISYNLNYPQVWIYWYSIMPTNVCQSGDRIYILFDGQQTIGSIEYVPGGFGTLDVIIERARYYYPFIFSQGEFQYERNNERAYD